MALNYGFLVKEAIALLNRFNSTKQCLDNFIEDASKDLQDMKRRHLKFIVDVVSGCVEHKKLLDVVVSVFYDQNKRCLSRHDRSQFVVICYLTTFALDDLGLEHFRNIVQSLDIKKIQLFLTFFFKNLTTWIQEKWNHIYDAAYVEENWVDPLQRWRSEIENLMEQLSLELSNENLVKKPPIKVTKPKEFALTKPKPRPLPMPELIPQQMKSKPAPLTTYMPPKEMQKIEEIKLKNQQGSQKVMPQIAANFISQLQSNSFHSSHPPPSNNKVRAKEPDKIEHRNMERRTNYTTGAEAGKPLVGCNQRAAQLKKVETNNTPIKLNRAVKLMQTERKKRQMEEEIQKVERLVEGTHEPSAFLRWQKEIRAKDLQEKLDTINRRFMEQCTNNAKGAKARKHLVGCNQRAAQLKKEETAEVMRRYAEERLQEEKEIKEMVQQVAKGHKNPKMAKEKLQILKQSIVKEVAVQNRKLLQQALEEAEEEFHRKCKIIQEIHAIEAVPHMRVRQFDDTETAGCNLLVEMSHAELKERLVRLKEKKKAEEQEKRERILMEKQKEKLEMKQFLEQEEDIYKEQRAQAQAAAIRKEEERNANLRLEQEKKKKMEKVFKEYQRKRDEDKEWRVLGFERAKPPKQVAANTRTVKVKTWEECERGIEFYIQKLLEGSPL